ncbi:MAG: ChaN family lipoprotein [Pyrodictiaceae archaeon]
MFTLWRIRPRRRASLEELAKDARSRDIVFLGEIHENLGVLEAELSVLNTLASQCKHLMLFLEMFNYMQQPLLDKYLEGKMSWQELVREYSRSREGFSLDHYKPLIDLAASRGLKVYGVMPPREYASQVARRGLKALREVGEQLVGEEDIDKGPPGYRERFMELIPREGPMAALDPEKLLEAQAYKDTIASRIIVDKLSKTSCSYKPRALVIMGYGHVEHVGTVPHRVSRYGYDPLVITSRTAGSKEEAHRILEELARDPLLIADYLVVAYELGIN